MCCTVTWPRVEITIPGLFRHSVFLSISELKTVITDIVESSGCDFASPSHVVLARDTRYVLNHDPHCEVRYKLSLDRVERDLLTI